MSTEYKPNLAAKLDAIRLKRNPNYKPEQPPKVEPLVCTCDSEYIEPHTCPYKTEIENDYDALCTCCEACEDNCNMEI